MKRNQTLFIKFIAALLSVVLITPCDGFAATPETSMPLASSRIKSYNATISPQGNGKISINFSVTGIGKMDDLGVTSIILYESEDNYDWFAVKTYYSSGYSNLMGSNVVRHTSSVTYQGTAGCYYEAHICYFAGDETGSDACQTYTAIVKAT